MASLTFLDTNVLAYAYDRGQPAKQARAIETIQSVDRAVVSTQVMLELFSVLTRKLRVSPTQAQTAIDDLMNLEVVPSDARLVRSSIALSISDGISHWDAMVVLAASRAGCEVLMTEDLQDGRMIEGVRVVNPFT